MTIHLEESEELVHAGEHQKLLGLDPGCSTPVENLDQLLANRAPVEIKLTLGVDLLTLETIDDLRRLTSEIDGQCIRERMGRVRRRHQGAMTGIGCGQSRGRGNRRLPNSPLAGDEDDPHGQPPLATRFLRPRNAVLTICFSAWRLMNPGMMKLGSTVSEYTTSVASPSAGSN